MLSLIFGLGGRRLETAYSSPSVLFDLVCDPVARPTNQPGSGIVQATRHCLKDVAGLKLRVLAR